MDYAVSKRRTEVDDSHENKLSEIRSALIVQGVFIQGLDDSTLLRFLRARTMNVQKASKMLAEHQAWRASFVPLGFISENQVQSELAQSKAYLQGISKKTGCPLLIMVSRNHFLNKADFEEFKRFVVYVLDKTIASAPAGVDKYVVIVDLEGVGYKNMDLKSLVSGLQLLQDYYPERLAKLFFVRAPSIFGYFWRLASPLVDKVTKEKIEFLEKNKIGDVLLEEFGDDVIPRVYGGKAEMMLIQDAYVPNWPTK